MNINENLTIIMNTNDYLYLFHLKFSTGHMFHEVLAMLNPIPGRA